MEKLSVILSASSQVLFEPKRFYDLNISLARCKNNIPAQGIIRTYDTYVLKANKGLRLGWQMILRKIPVHRYWKVFSTLPQCADRYTKSTFSVDTFTSPKSTHWKNSNIQVLATHPKVHNSTLKVKVQLIFVLHISIYDHVFGFQWHVPTIMPQISYYLCDQSSQLVLWMHSSIVVHMLNHLKCMKYPISHLCSIMYILLSDRGTVLVIPLCVQNYQWFKQKAWWARACALPFHF
jgi:hypothetical protein